MSAPRPPRTGGGGFPAFVGQSINVALIVATTWSALTTTISTLRWLCWILAVLCTLLIMATAAGILKGGRS